MIATVPFLANGVRAQARAQMAEKIRHLPYDRLLSYGISSYRQITNLDIIGIPVWVCYRPLARTISVTAGKNADDALACAGAIVEGLEFWATENPNSQMRLCSYRQLASERADYDYELLEMNDYPLAKDNVLDLDTPVAWEVVDKIRLRPDNDPSQAWMPSHVIWLLDRAQQQFLDVQQTSNGLASGVTLEDALLQGFYELVERDGWTCAQYVRETLGTAPIRIPLIDLPPELEWSVSLIRRAGLYPFLHNCGNELGIPVLGCALFGPDNVGYFGGYGCHLNPRVAAQRAILEAVQSRLCYISGARDDLYRRDFMLMKQSDSKRLIQILDNLPTFKPTWPKFAELFFCDGYEFQDPREEFRALVSKLQVGGIDRLYYRVMRVEEFEGQSLTIVRAIAPQLEGVWCENWKTNGRAHRRLGQEVAKAADGTERR